jgi:ribonuclease HI
VKKVTIITDGSCLGNPGRGGWACILRHNEHTSELYGSAPHTTNNRMELTAAIEGLRAPEERHHHVGSELEAEQLDDQLEEAGGQSGPVGRAG